MHNILSKYSYRYEQAYSPRRKMDYWLVIPQWDEKPEDFKQLHAAMRQQGAEMWIWQKDAFAFYQAEKPQLGTEKTAQVSKAKTAHNPTVHAWRGTVDEKGTDYAAYTAADIETAARYEGLGGMANKDSDFLKNLKPEERTGILDQFYTPLDIAARMWGLAEKHGFTPQGAKVLEPACGSGRFLRFATEGMQVDAYEPDIYPFVAAKLLHPGANVQQAKFDSLFYKNGDPRFWTGESVRPRYDLVIGNPPYREFKSEYSAKEKKATGAHTYDQYFIRRGCDLLKSGGLLIFVIPSTFLLNGTKYNAFKKSLDEIVEMIDAYRLPSGIFPNTQVQTDIVVFKKR